MLDISSFLTPSAIKKINSWQKSFNVKVIITSPKKTRLGVFIQKRNGCHVIKINNNLNKYSFLITLIHEFAHASVADKFKNNVSPHGQEWKYEFRKMMLSFLTPRFFPNDILECLSKHLINPSSSTFRDVELSKILQKYDNRKIVTVHQLDDGDEFKTIDGKKFRRICKLRKNYKCINLENSRLYRVSPLTEVDVI
tara:strand:+ start:203 stop:790 length:588 start_codon:yes stop_codon:yes gene_type:complete